MKKKILIIGKKSFIAINLYKNLSKIFLIKKISYENFLKLDSKKLNEFDVIINSAIKKNYKIKIYNIKNDIDLQIAKHIQKLNIKFVFLSTRKVYKIGDDIKENSKTHPLSNYSKNKLKTEKKLLHLIKDKVLILRITNILGNITNNKKKRKIHNTFIDQFFSNIKRGFIYNNYNNYKDFLSINQFSKIVELLIKKDAYGIYNVSAGKKVYVYKIIKWLNYYNKKKLKIKKLPPKFNDQNFYLNNFKLLKKIKTNIYLTNLEKDCKRISKIYFKK